MYYYIYGFNLQRGHVFGNLLSIDCPRPFVKQRSFVEVGFIGRKGAGIADLFKQDTTYSVHELYPVIRRSLRTKEKEK